ncbi:MAG: serine/threonine protein kinase [Pirellulales bacterium]|nr:serine/threonine protein kinase [Pirellulales bacterium]
MNPQRHERIKELFLNACDLTEDRRNDFLTRECGKDSALRDEVESWLRHHDTRSILDNTRGDPPEAKADGGGPARFQRSLRAAAHAIAAITGDLETRGKLALGAAAIVVLLALGAGIAVAIGWREAYAPVGYLHTAFGAVFGLLLATSAALAASVRRITALKRQIDDSRVLGPYTLARQIGEGGMGCVYLARHALLKRPAAVKLLKREVAGEQALARFQREVQIASQLTHPNTIAIYDYGRTPEGVFYYAMEYLPGIHLGQLVSIAGALPASRAVYLLRQVCSSLREAHERGLVHRDIKPQNIMLCRRGGEADFVKILDFGLVKPIEPSDTEITRPGMIAGTPLYLAPERLRDPSLVDPRSDLYAIGAVGFYLLTGREVFPASSNVEALHAAVHSAPSPPSQYATGEIPPDLDRLVLDCLAKEPACRPPDVAAVIERLDGIDFHRVWRQADARRWWQENESRLRELIGEGFT